MPTCPHCGKPLKAGVALGLCPECLLKAGLAGDTSAADSAHSFTPPSPEELGAHFPQLEIVELLGRGGMGAVYKARQINLDRIVALKILPPDIGRDPAFAERFVREAKALAKLNHPNIVTLYESGRADGLYFFLMEFVDGVNLRQLLEAGRVEPREALAIVPQVCDALQYAHDQGIVHRDIKPANILLDRRGRVKVADFGLAKLIGGSEPEARGLASASSETKAGQVLGTPQYMAPEQIDDPMHVDHRADIYSLGVVIYQMLTGEMPASKLEPPSRKVQIDVRLDEVVLRAMEKEPARRYQQIREVRTQVETIGSAPASKPVEIRERRPMLDPRVIAVVAFLFMAILGFGFLLLMKTSPNHHSSMPSVSPELAPPNEPARTKPLIAPPKSTQAPTRAPLITAQPAIQDVDVEILRVQLRQAEESMPLLEAREKAGQIDMGTVLDAKDNIEILKAAIAGEGVQVARLRLAMAERQLKLAELKFDRGLIDGTERKAAKNAVELRQVELRLAENAATGKR